MTARLISVIMPVFNGERYLAEALDSVLAQTQRPLEVIVVDDGSTDGTAAALDAYGDRIVRLWQPNLGPGVARNTGLARASGAYLSFMDADDVLHPEKLERQLACLDAHPDVDVCRAYAQNFWIEELQHERERLDDWAMTSPQLGSLLQGLLAHRRVFAMVGGFDVTLRVGSDTDWFIRADEFGVRIRPLPEVLVYRRVHRTNITRVRANELKGDMAEVVKAALNRRRAAAARLASGL